MNNVSAIMTRMNPFTFDPLLERSLVGGCPKQPRGNLKNLLSQEIFTVGLTERDY